MLFRRETTSKKDEDTTPVGKEGGITLVGTWSMSGNGGLPVCFLDVAELRMSEIWYSTSLNYSAKLSKLAFRREYTS